MTMVELMVSLAIVMVVIGAAATAYLKLLRTYKVQGRLAESYMANLTGLELLRYDIETAGFGLPTNLSGVTYNEAVADLTVPYVPTELNDSTNNPPRALVHLNNLGANNSDVLTIKSSRANINTASAKWSMILPGTPPTVKVWGDPVMDFTTNDNFTVLDNNGVLQLTNGLWINTFNPPALPVPPATGVYYMYGLDNGSGLTHIMPFNRVDYYLDKRSADFPSSCAASTYTLYRSTISQQTGALSYTPLIDCVRDFQVAFGLDNPNADGAGNPAIQWQANLLQPGWMSAPNTPMSASQIQQYLREVRVFLLYQEGLGDTGSTPDFRFSGTLNLGDQDIANGLDPADYPSPPNNFVQLSSSPLLGQPQLSSFTPTGADLQYRWKVLEMDIKPMNLNLNLN